MKPRSRNSGPSTRGQYLQYEESSDEDDVQMESSDSDYDGISDERQGFASMIGDNRGERHLDLSHEQESEFVFSAMEGFVSDSDPEDKIQKGRNVGLKKKKGRKIDTKVLEGKEVLEDVVDGSNQEKLEVPELVIDYQAEVNIKDKRRRRQMKINMPILMWEFWEEQDDRWVEANARIITDNQTDVMVETAETPSDLILPLLRYQKEWLAWALKQEKSAARGGILADEMGMGKTVQAIALVLAKGEFNRTVGEHNRVLSSYSSSAGLPEIKATLVICPVVALRQWENEIDRFTSKGSIKVLVYHGAKRGKTLHEFSEYDFVITTYSIVEAEYRKNVMPPKVKCGCGKSFSERKMISHLRHCRWNDIKQSEQSPDKAETSKQKTSDKGKDSESEDDKRKEVHKKKRKNYNEKDFGGGSCTENSADVESGLCKRKFSLHSVKWNRIILDEAHYTKNRCSNTTKAVHALESSYKWALSGTPVQNDAGEILSLIRFLQILPYSYYFCKDCNCRTLDYSLTTHCPNCLHHSVRHFCWWSKFVAKPIRTRRDSDDGRKAMILLYHKILKSILLRRTKEGRAAELSLPPRIFKVRRDSLDTKEEDFYTSVYNNCEAEFNTFVNVNHGVMNNFVHIFDLLMRLRQAVNHFYLVEYSESAMVRSAGVRDDNNGEKVTSCAIKGFKPTSILNKIQLDGFQSSTKIDALREEIRFMLERDGSAKGIVFSQFTSFLDLIHYSLRKCGVNCVQLDGSMSTDEKNAAIKRFTEDPDCRIFLVSLKAGGVALNLTVASHVFLMDPWWNPAVEKQAQDRIHRIGQYKPIRIVRFVIENTIEEKLLKLQQKKELVFEGTVDGSLEALGKLTEDDLRFLFS